MNPNDQYFDVIEGADEEESSTPPGWYKRALAALTTYAGEMGDKPFSSEDFRRWAVYYLDLDDPSDHVPYSWLFCKARDHHIVKVAHARVRSGYSAGEKTLWVAA